MEGRRHMKELVRKFTPTIVILLETHCAYQKASKFWERLGYDISGCSEAQGHACGIFPVSVMDVYGLWLFRLKEALKPGLALPFMLARFQL